MFLKIRVTSLCNLVIHKLLNQVFFIISLQHAWAFVTVELLSERDSRLAEKQSPEKGNMAGILGSEVSKEP